MGNSKWLDEYKSKLITAEEAARQVESGSRISMPPGVGEPRGLCNAIAARARAKEIEGVNVDTVYTFKGNDLYDPALEGNIILSPLFLCTPQRWAITKGVGEFTPLYYGDCCRHYERGYGVVDTFVAEVSPMDKHGYFTFGASVSNSITCAKYAKKVILEVNDKQPRVFGDNFIHISEVDFVIENNHDLDELPILPTSKDDEVIGKYIADLIPDGACLQIGVGGVPSAVANFLSDKKELGVHTELMSEVYLELIDKGAITNSKKTINHGKSVFTFALGTRKLYDYLDDNPAIASFEVGYTNDPYVIAQNDNMISINATLQVDLTGQCCSESMGPKQYSAVGGQADYLRGAYLSKGGKSILCTYSTAKKGTVSSIVPMLTEGAYVSAQRQSVMYIATEYGLATLVGKSTRERTKELINVAHPNYRDQLKFEAKKMNLM